MIDVRKKHCCKVPEIFGREVDGVSPSARSAIRSEVRYLPVNGRLSSRSARGRRDGNIGGLQLGWRRKSDLDGVWIPAQAVVEAQILEKNVAAVRQHKHVKPTRFAGGNDNPGRIGVTLTDSQGV